MKKMLRSVSDERNFFLSSRDQKRTCFTLIELLVVIAIIAILAAILLPALNSARTRGQISTCINNNKQFSTAIAMYTGDNDGFYMVTSNKYYTDGPTAQPSQSGSWGWKLHSGNYLTAGPVYTCPIAYPTYMHPSAFGHNDVVNLGSATAFSYIGYGYNVCIGGGPSNSGTAFYTTKDGKIKNPSSKVLITESMDVNSNGQAVGNHFVRSKMYTVAAHNNPFFATSAGRTYEKGSTTVLWADGHVAELANPVAEYQDEEKYFFPEE